MQKIINRVQQNLTQNHYVEAEDIQALVDVARDQQWVSVGERLPKEGAPVVIKVKNKDTIFQAHLTHHIEPNIWVIEGYSRSVWQDRVSFYVTHWQPLPEPPTLNNKKHGH